jgi:hypothetical protein
MMARRIERIATLVVLVLTACTVLPPPRAPVHTETRRVSIPGEEADTLAETSGASEGELVPVRTHDGRDLWVRESTLAGATLVPGTWVLVRREGHVVSLAVTRSMDDYVEVSVAGVAEIVPIGDVVARLHHGPPTDDVVPPVVTDVVTPPPTEPAAPPTPLARMVLLEEAPRSRAGSLEGCSGSTAHVTFHDGSDVHVPTSALHPVRVRAGDHVSALWNDTPYPAVILATRDSLVQARWEDGSEQWVELSDVQSVDGHATGAIHGCAPRRVLVDEGARTRIGRVLACEAGQATLLDADGAPRTTGLETLTRVPLRVGDPIEARWNGTAYEAVVLSIGDVIHVRWYDGSENDVDPADLVMVRLPAARPSEPVSCPSA